MNRPPPDAPAPASPRLLLFDLDDTLCDYAAARAMRLRRAFAPALATLPPGRAPHPDDLIAASVAIHPHGTDHFPDLLARYGVADPAVAVAAADWYRANRFHGLALFGDTVAALRSLRDQVPERRMGLVTNGPAEIQRAKVALLAIAPLVDFVLVSEAFGAWKPDPAIFREALRLGGATAAEAVFLGDSAEHDIAGARAAGIRAVWMNRAGVPWPGPGPAPDDAVRDLAGSRALLR